LPGETLTVALNHAPATSSLERVASYLAWPLLVGTSAAILAFGFGSGHPAMLSETLRKAWFFNLSYLWLLCWLLLLERRWPWRRAWQWFTACTRAAGWTLPPCFIASSPRAGMRPAPPYSQ
jgi:hypothetical protein